MVAGRPSSVVACSIALRQVEADGDGGKLPLMADRQRRNRGRRPFGEGGQGHFAARGRRAQKDLVERRRIALQRRQNLHDHVVAGELREILRDLALPESVVERVVDQLWRQSVA